MLISIWCARKGLRCEYLDSEPKPVSERSAQAHQSQLPNVFFLDHEVYLSRHMEIPVPSLPVPAYILGIVGNNMQVRATAATFFSTVHTYLPIVSKQIFHSLLNPLLPLRADVALLCLCMKVIIWTPSVNSDGPQTSDYLASKRYLVELENSGVFTVPMLQARVLISMYEYGQGIYPAAYLSIGACASHAIALGLGDGRKQIEDAGRVLSWVEQEERRRIWWAIVTLERYVWICTWAKNLLTSKDDVPWVCGTTILHT